MMNIGYRPTAGSQTAQTIEVHIFDFDADLYNETVRVYFRKRIRDEMHFASLEELIARLERDKVEISHYFTHINKHNI